MVTALVDPAMSIAFANILSNILANTLLACFNSYFLPKLSKFQILYRINNYKSLADNQ